MLVKPGSGGGGKLADDAAERVKAATDLHALVVGDGIVLKREGREWKGLCPFHNEKSPSFGVVPARQIYHCFGCGEGGDAIAWMQKRHGMDFVEAVKELGSRAGIDVSPGGASAPAALASAGSSTPAARRLKVGGGGGKAAPPAPAGPRRPTPFDFRPDLDKRCRAELDGPDGAPVMDYLRRRPLTAEEIEQLPEAERNPWLAQGRALSRSAIEHFNLGAFILRAPDGAVRARYLAIPCYARDGTLLTVRFRTIPGPCLECSGPGSDCKRCKGKGEVKKAFLHCPIETTPSGALPLFNSGCLPADPSVPVPITEGELDVIAGWDFGIRIAVSGTGGAGEFLDAWYEELEPYRNFVLCYDGDGPGEEGAKTVADRLGRYRCSRAVLPRKDLGECLQVGLPPAEIRSAIQHARPMVTTRFSTIGSYRDAVERRIASPSLLVGLPTGSARLDKILGGWRPGLIVVTGGTGSGKTSFTAWALREQALRGVPCLATCFEQSPEQLSEKFLRMEVGGDFTKVDQAARFAAWDALDAMPGCVAFLDHYGKIPKAELLDSIRYAVRRLDVRFAVIDHAGYVDLGVEANDTNVTDFMIELAALGVNEGISLVTICHPNRMNVAQQRRVGMSDLKGSSGIEQNAHAVLVVERNPIGKTATPSTTLHLDKVRSEFGLPGSSCSLAYDPLATTYADAWEQTPMGRTGRSGGTVIVPDAGGDPVPVPTQRRRSAPPVTTD